MDDDASPYKPPYSFIHATCQNTNPNLLSCIHNQNPGSQQLDQVKPCMASYQINANPIPRDDDDGGRGRFISKK